MDPVNATTPDVTTTADATPLETAPDATIQTMTAPDATTATTAPDVTIQTTAA
ncbi:hypothetical protein GGF32_002378, partial [Allomyces javanicus]